MKRLTAVVSTLFLPALLCAQPRSINLQPTLRGGFGNVVFPGGGGNLPGVTRSFGNTVFPGGGGPRLNVPLSSNDPTRQIAPFGVPPRNVGFGQGRRQPRSSRSSIYAVPYAVPVYFGGDPYYGGYAEGYPPPEQQAAPSQPNVVVVYPQAAQPVYVDRYGNQASVPPVYEPAPAAQPSAADSTQAVETQHYLIAFKDHTIYSAVAYWVDGNTLHYFTSGSTHNQVSLSLVDRELTDRLNRESGNTVQLPRN